MNIKFQKAAVVFLIIISGYLFYSNTLGNEFVYDDLVIIANNDYLNSYSNIRHIFSEKYFLISGERSYRPVSTLIFFIVNIAGKGSPEAFRILSISIHILCAVFAFLFLCELFKTVSIPAFSALLALLHPIQTEAVNGMSFLEDPLSTLFMFVSLYCYVVERKRGRITSRFLLSCLFFLLSVFSKENTAFLPALILLIEFVYQGGGGFIDRVKELKYKFISYLLVLIVFYVIRFVIFVNPVAGSSASYPGGGPVGAIPVMSYAFLTYLKLYFIPNNLSIEHCRALNVSWASIWVYVSIMLHSGLFLIAWMLRKESPRICFGALFFLLSLVPISNVVPFGAIMAERYYYIPAYAMSIFVVTIFIDSDLRSKSLSPLLKNMNTYFVVCIILMFGFMTYQRNVVWKDSVSLWGSALKGCPQSSRAHAGYGRSLLYSSDDPEAISEAIEHLKYSIKLDPDHYEPMLSLGTAYWKSGELKPALDAYMNAYSKHPTNDVRYNAALVMNRLGMFEESLKMTDEIIQIEPEWAESRYLRGNTLLRLGRSKEAINEYEIVLGINKNHIAAKINLGAALINQKDYDRAEIVLEDVLSMEPENEYAKKNLSRLRKLREGRE